MTKEENDFVSFEIINGILFTEFKTKTIIDLEVAKTMIELRHKISAGENKYWCFDFSNLKFFTKEGRDYADIHGQDFLNATAVIVDSSITKFIGNTWFRLKKPSVPMQIFTNKENAVSWLDELKNSKEN